MLHVSDNDQTPCGCFAALRSKECSVLSVILVTLPLGGFMQPTDTQATFDRRDLTARVLAYLSPYLFWSLVCLLTGGIWLLA